MDQDQLWAAERRLWLEGESAFQAMLAQDCTMVFPEPVGLLTGQAIIESLKGVPRWTAVNIDQAKLIRPSDELAILVYRAEGQRDGSEPYYAFCSSAYARTTSGEWLLHHHQHTPIA